MNQLFETALKNVQSFKGVDKQVKPENLTAAKTHFLNIITDDVEDKIQKASKSGKTQILMYRMNFRFDNKPNWPSYYLHDLNVKDLLQNPEYGLLDDLRAKFGTVKDGEQGFKLELVNTSKAIWCLFLYWRDNWEEESNTSTRPVRRQVPQNKENKESSRKSSNNTSSPRRKNYDN